MHARAHMRTHVHAHIREHTLITLHLLRFFHLEQKPNTPWQKYVEDWIRSQCLAQLFCHKLCTWITPCIKLNYWKGLARPDPSMQLNTQPNKNLPVQMTIGLVSILYHDCTCATFLCTCDAYWSLLMTSLYPSHVQYGSLLPIFKVCIVHHSGFQNPSILAFSILSASL